MSFPASKSPIKNLRKGRGNREFKALKPQLTSMVDAVILILIYLLQSFSAEGEIVTVSKDLQLPQSTAQKTPKLTVTIIVNQKTLMAEHQEIANVDDILKSDDMMIPELYQWLGERRAATEKIAQYSTTTKFTGDITIQGDKRIRFRLLKKIMYTAGQQGFNNFLLAVQKKG